MKANQIEALEGYIKTENEHWNGFAFQMLCELLQSNLFEDPSKGLRLFSDSIDLITEHNSNPVKAFQGFKSLIAKEGLNDEQSLCVYTWVYSYLQQSEFDFDHKAIKELVRSERERLKAIGNSKAPVTKNLRATLKDMMQKELESLPDTLKALQPVQRLNVLCKLIPFVLPKVESVDHELDED